MKKIICSTTIWLEVPHKISDFIEKLKSEIPENATVDLDYEYNDWDDTGSPSLLFSWYREETDIEHESRLKRENAEREVKKKAAKRDRQAKLEKERKEYERLKAKFEK